MAITMPIRIYTGNTSLKPIIINLVKVVAKPIKKAIAKAVPIIFT